MKHKIGLIISGLCFFAATNTFATMYPLPSSNESIIGHNKVVTTTSGTKVVDLMKKYDLGYNTIEEANPQYDLKKPLPGNAKILLPIAHLLPNGERNGIVINLPEMRMYYFPKGKGKVITYPIGIGKIGQTIPITPAVITKKAIDPVWIPTPNIRAFNLRQGVVLPQVMPPGPDNPLGHYAIYMTIPTYLMHSTLYPESVGKRASFGCIRMYEWDIERFYPTVYKGIPIAIVNSPNKVGWQDDKLYMESHTVMEEHNKNEDATLPGIVHLITETTKNQPALIDWQAVSYVANVHDGLPHDIGMKI